MQQNTDGRYYAILPLGDDGIQVLDSRGWTDALEQVESVYPGSTQELLEHEWRQANG